MTQVRGNAAPNAAAPGDRTSLGRLIGAGLILVSLILLALGAYLGPYTYATSTPGKLTVNNCTVEYKYRSSSSSSRRKTKTRWCYGTFTADDGSVKDLNAELRSDALYRPGHVLEARKTGDTSYQQDRGWVAAIALGCVFWFSALFCIGISLAVGSASARSSKQASGQGLVRTVVTSIVVGVIGFVISLLVTLFA